MCGGTDFFSPVSAIQEGLSPRVRGNLQLGFLDSDQRRSIPACAGEPTCPHWNRTPTEVYPRVCGGTYLSFRSDHSTYGLSPRVRGNRDSPRQAPRMSGSIPACAGEPGRVQQFFSLDRVYPRVCGGTERIFRSGKACTGLSPRVRGNLVIQRTAASLFRSIPACAGEPFDGIGRELLQGVYPRVCGGTGLSDALQKSKQGLSPRVRGNQGKPLAAAALDGSIPACAGEPLW